MMDDTDDKAEQAGVKLYWEELRKEVSKIKNSRYLVLTLSMNQTAHLCHLKIKESAFETWMKEGLVPALKGIFKQDGDSISISNLVDGQMILSVKIQGDKNDGGSGYEFLHDLLDNLWKSIPAQNIQSVEQIKNYTHVFVNAYWLEQSVNKYLNTHEQIQDDNITDNADNKNRLKI